MTLFSNLQAAVSALSVNKASAHPTAKDSARVETALFEPETPASNVDDQRVRSGPRVTNVVVKHSSAFNSQREAGMNKLEQLQFVQALKATIIG
ncbi:hypothetical protein EK21DRAFT_46503, partial [Setomelanomma holmii]